MARNEKLVKADEIAGRADGLRAEKQTMHDLYMQDGDIDETEQAALDRMDAKLEKLREAVTKLRDEVAANKAAWDGRSGELDTVKGQFTTLQRFGHKDADGLEDSIGAIPQAEADERWLDAAAALDQAKTKLAPIWADYERQKAAKDQYDTLRGDIDTRLSAARAFEPQTEAIAGQITQIETALSGIDGHVEQRDYVTALADANTAKGLVDALEEALRTTEGDKSDYEAQLATLQPKLGAVSVSEFQTLEAAQQTLLTLQGEMESRAAAHDYAGAVAKLGAVSAEVDTLTADFEALRQARDSYESGLAGIQGRLGAAKSSQMETTAEVQARIGTLETEMSAAAESEDFAAAGTKQAELVTALEEFESQTDARDLYEVRLAAIQEELAEASGSDPRYPFLTSITASLATIQGEMEAAASGENYDTALTKIGELEAKLLERSQAIEAKKAEYEAARATLDQEVVRVESVPYSAVEPEAQAVRDSLADVDAAAGEEDWPTALEAVTASTALVTAFDTALAAHETALKAKIAPNVTKARASLAKCKAAQSVIKDTLAQLIVKVDRKVAANEDLETALEESEQAVAKAAELEKVFEIREAVENADWKDNDQAAMDLYEKYKNGGDLKELPIEARNLLIENMLSDGMFESVEDDERAAIQDIWATAETLDPQFEEYDKKTTDEIVKNLSNDPKIKDYAARWTELDDAEKEKAMKEIGTIVGGENGWKMEGIDDIEYSAQKGSCNDKPGLRGWHREGNWLQNEEISVCTGNSSGEWNPQTDFNDVIMNLTHEVGHGYQEQLIEQYESGDLKPGHPAYEQAKYLSLDRKYFDKFPDDYDKWKYYVHSPMEQQSRHTANRVRGDLPAEYGAGYTQELK